MTKPTFLASRRTVLKGAAATGLAFAMPAIITHSTRAQAAEPGVIRMLASVTAPPRDLALFEKETGLKLEFTPFNVDDIGALYNEIIVNGGMERYDILGMLGGMQKGFVEQDAIRPIDTSKLKNFAGIPESISRNSLLYAGDNVDWGVPLFMNSDSFGYFPEKTGQPRPPELLTWDLLLNSEDTLGKSSMEADQIALMIGGMYMKTRDLATISDPGNMTPDECKTVADWLIERKKAGQFRNFWKNYDEQMANFANGEVVVQRCWEPIVKDSRKQGLDVEYAYCSDFHVNWMHGAFVTTPTATSDRMEDVYKTLDWFSGGSYAAAHATNTGYTCSRMDLALEYVQAEGWSEEDVAAVKENQEKVEFKLSNPNFWIPGMPDEMKVYMEQAERFRNA